MSAAKPDDDCFALRGRYLFPITGPPIAGGVLTIRGERIEAVGENLFGSPPIDLGQHAIVPGFVNAHTHLEFSDLESPLGEPGMPFADWIRCVLNYREQRKESLSEVAWQRSIVKGWGRQYISFQHLAIAQGSQQSRIAGTTSLGDIFAFSKNSYLSWDDKSADVTVFVELIGLSEERAGEAIAWAKRFFDFSIKRSEFQPVCLRPGISPHAPYTVGPRLLEDAVELSRERKIPLAIHLAESQEELQFLQSLSGPLRELLDERKIPTGTLSPGKRPLDYLRTLAAAHRTLVIHGNYLDKEEIAFLASQSEQMSVVYCPRTHAYFGHETYPLAQLWAAGVHVALGTDSRASNPDLKMLEEIRFVALNHRILGPATALRLGTLSGAEALGISHEVGSLEPGKYANLAIIALPRHDAADPHELLLDPSSRVDATWHHGQRVGASTM